MIMYPTNPLDSKQLKNNNSHSRIISLAPFCESDKKIIYYKLLYYIRQTFNCEITF